LAKFVTRNGPNIDAYLFCYERYATCLQLEPTQWPIYLSALLNGKAQTLYYYLCSANDGQVDYATLKEHLLMTFLCGADGFREKLGKSDQRKVNLGVALL